jgi:hypothetical protein
MTDPNEPSEKKDPDLFLETGDPDHAVQDDVAAGRSAGQKWMAPFRQRLSWPWASGVGAGVLTVALAVIFWGGLSSRGPDRPQLHAPGQILLPVPGKHELHLNDFLIQMAAGSSDTGIAFSLRIRSGDAAFIEMSTQEKVWLRAHIYDTLLTQVQKEIEPPSLDMVTFWATRTIKEIFPGRSIDGVVPYNFLVI